LHTREIFGDPVFAYSYPEAVVDGYLTDMKPVATTRTTTFQQLVSELASLTDEPAIEAVLGELLAKFARKKRHLQGDAAEQFEQVAGVPPEGFAAHLRGMDLDAVRDFFAARPELPAFLDRRLSAEPRILISNHEDGDVETTRGYGAGRTRPEDYLDSFAEFVRSRMNELPALAVVTQRPRELTREQLKALKLALDAAGYDEVALRTAWRQKSNVDIAASIIGYIRQAALGDPLVPYEERVDHALTRILSSRAWDVHQRKWLDRIAKQMKENTVVDAASLNRPPFAKDGGFKRLNRIFEGRLEEVLGEMSDELWKEGA
ncbi:MAG: type I restriction-modification enzyme R subunit C-terminal domain-containing protein, partial [Sandaracinaceae bacterium]